MSPGPRPYPRLRRDLGALWRAFASYQGAPLATRTFVACRLAIAPLAALGEEVRSLEGRMLSLGSGISVIERYLAELNPRLQIEGIDLDPRRVELIRATSARAPRVTLRQGDALALDEPPVYDSMLICDALHHFEPDAHRHVAEAVAQGLRPGGVCIVKDLDTTPRWKHEWNRLHDRVVAGPEPIFCRTPDDLANILAGAGLVPDHATRIDRHWEPYAHYIVRARKP